MVDDEARGPRAERDRGPRTLTASEAAVMIGVSVATIRGWADSGKLPVHRTVGGHRRFDVEQLHAWLTERGAPTPEPRRLRRTPQDVPACPATARELNGRTDEVLDRVLAGYDPDVPTPLPAPSQAVARRQAIRFLRIVAAGLESGRPGVAAGRIELAGLRGGLEGVSGGRVLVEHARIATAIVITAEHIHSADPSREPLALASLQAVIDHVLAALARGYEDALPARPAPAPTRPPLRRP